MNIGWCPIGWCPIGWSPIRWCPIEWCCPIQRLVESLSVHSITPNIRHFRGRPQNPAFQRRPAGARLLPQQPAQLLPLPAALSSAAPRNRHTSASLCHRHTAPFSSAGGSSARQARCSHSRTISRRSRRASGCSSTRKKGAAEDSARFEDAGRCAAIARSSSGGSESRLVGGADIVAGELG